MAVASLVLGILSILFVFTGPFSFIGIILGIIGIVTGVLARREAPENTLSTGGLVTSIIGCALSLLLNIACIACITGSKSIFDQAAKDPQVQKSFDDFTKKLKQLEQEANKEAQKEALKKKTF
ncbi:MAG TPA: DUF4190 domain-containing protein [Spirochaetota bacterium]|nr:DUF4190 domain-containing protein [Spirochaetota bacterium]HPG51811.1 DUF4190 domain-containing protein [Spirochaetota bacterium]HPN11140.1 DUF4190 domain-containing protein [Spirochaetota bacterium]